MKTLAFIVPVLNEEHILFDSYNRLTDIRKELPQVRVGITFIDDGSSDGSLETLRKIAKDDASISIISLSRNFGSHSAIRAGLNFAKTDAVVIISADLQDPPEIIKDMVRAWENGNNIVWAIRESRKDPFFTRLFAAIFHVLMKRFAISNYPQKGIDFCLIDKRVYKFIISQQERNTNIFGLILWSGFKQAYISYIRGERKVGFSKWTFGKKLKLLVDSFVSFSFLPIRLVTYLGFVFSGLASAYIIHLLIYYFKAKPIQGWTSLAALISTGFALLFLMLGIIGEYLWRVLEESRKRPLYIINETINLESEGRL